MYNLSLSSLGLDDYDGPGGERKKFETEQEAIDFARSERRNWDRITVYRQGQKEPLLRLYGSEEGEE
jgi:hypothetical protein